VSRRVYPGTRHELHNDSVARQEVDDIVGWVRDRVSHMHTPAGPQVGAAAG
jgi:hypothetical protein